MKESVKKVLKALSTEEIEVETSRNLANLKGILFPKRSHNTMDIEVLNGDYPIPVRVYYPDDEILEKRAALLFFHGGGWVTDNIDNYERICVRMAEETKRLVISVEYRLAPEYKFPTGLNDCYEVAKVLFEGMLLEEVDTEDITLIGDSAGGNLAASVSLMARDKKEFLPKRQILIYPATNCDYTENSPFASVHENGREYILTAGKMRDYIKLYASCEEDKKNKYFAPLNETDYTDQPDTLVITAEFDPLRDEGEEYANRLKKAGNRVEIYQVRDAIHGFFGLGLKHYHVEESLKVINQFLAE